VAPAQPAPQPSALPRPGGLAQPGLVGQPVAGQPGVVQPGVLAPGDAAARASAAALAAAAPPASVAAAVPTPPPDPPQTPTGTVYSATVEPNGRRRARWLGLLPRLAVGAHVATGPALRRLNPPSTASGVVVGFDADDNVATARLFQPEPTRMALVGGLWAARVLVFRTLALGASVTVLTGRPEAWHGFGRWATGSDERVVVRPLDAPFGAPSSPHAPVLVVRDGNALTGTVRGTLGPWQAQLSVVSQLTAYAFPAIREASLVAVQRLEPEEATAGTPLLGLTRESHALVRNLQNDMLALFDEGTPRYVWTQPTRIERGQFGPARRYDAPVPAR
jgi:hypothetical protein